MQQVSPTRADNGTQSLPAAFTISLETVFIALILLFSLALHLAELDTVSMTVSESPSALAAWRTVNGISGAETLNPAESALVFWSQVSAFSLLGASEFTARALTALVGVLAGLTPLLFRDVLGRTRALLLTVLLSLSSVLLLASRFGDGAAWALLLTALTLYAVKRWWKTSQNAWVITAVVAFSALVLLTGGSGPVFAVILLISGGVTLLFSTYAGDDLFEDDDTLTLQSVGARMRTVPLLPALGMSALIVVALSTAFMLFPQGLSMAGTGVGAFISNFVPTTDLNGAPFAYALGVALFYEPLVWLFAVCALVWIWRNHDFSLIERFFVVWFVVGLLFALIYGNPSPAAALWLTVPLAGLASYALAGLFYEDRMLSMWSFAARDADVGHLYNAKWGKWLVASATFALVIMFMIHLQELSRTLILVDGGSLEALINRIGENPTPGLRESTLWVVITLLFMIVGFLMAAGIWGSFTTLQGIGLGLLVFLLVAQVSAGWYAAVANANNPVEPYHAEATTSELALLRRSLIDIAKRETQGETQVPVTIVLDVSSGIDRNGLIAWTVRDFARVKYVNEVAEARTDGIVIITERAGLTLPDAGAPEDGPAPDLAGNYVGQPFILTRTWNGTTVEGLEWLTRVLVRRVRVQPQPSQTATLWLRMDVYDSVPYVPPVDESTPARG